jgi:hypothetical protein
MSQRVLTGKLPPKKFIDETLELELDDVETPTISSMNITKVIDDQVRSFHWEQNRYKSNKQFELEFQLKMGLEKIKNDLAHSAKPTV